MSRINALPSMTTVLTLISLFLFSLANARQTGSITLFTDSSCTTNPYANNFTLGADFCGKSTKRSSSTSSELSPFHSLRLIDRPLCTNGSFATFITYADGDCKEQVQSYKVTVLSPEVGYTDVQCEEGAEFKTMAFICNGFDDPDPGKAQSGDTSRTSDRRRNAAVEDGDIGSVFTIQTDTDVSTLPRPHYTFPTPMMPIPESALSAFAGGPQTLTPIGGPALSSAVTGAQTLSPIPESALSSIASGLQTLSPIGNSALSSAVAGAQTLKPIPESVLSAFGGEPPTLSPISESALSTMLAGQETSSEEAASPSSTATVTRTPATSEATASSSASGEESTSSSPTAAAAATTSAAATGDAQSLWKANHWEVIAAVVAGFFFA